MKLFMLQILGNTENGGKSRFWGGWSIYREKSMSLIPGNLIFGIWGVNLFPGVLLLKDMDGKRLV